MNHVKVTSKTYRDNSAKSINLPTILLEDNGVAQVFEQLHRYQLKYSQKSKSWHDKLVQAVGLLLDYMDANSNNYVNAKEFFESFVESLYSGTINEDGIDPSGLYWLPKKVKTTNILLNALNGFSDWLCEEYNTEQLNPWRSATRYEERMNWMAQINKIHHSFLGHLSNIHDMSETSKSARNVLSRKSPYAAKGDTKAFPEEKISELLKVGFKKSRKKKNSSSSDDYNWRDIAITILMHYGGLRHSEVFHLWIHDVMPDPEDPDMAMVRIYHPSEGKAPKDFKNPRTGQYINDRESYLLLKYGLIPRNQYAANDKRFAGWKDPRLDNESDKYMNVYWFPREAGYLFMKVWKMYMQQRILEGINDTHPFAFAVHDLRYLGDMMPLRTQTESYSAAVERIGLTVAKENGTTPHGHRHAYGQRLRRAHIEPKIIQVAMHHKSEESQKVYTEPTPLEITNSLNKAMSSMDSGLLLPMDTNIDAWINEFRKDTSYKE